MIELAALKRFAKHRTSQNRPRELRFISRALNVAAFAKTQREAYPGNLLL